MSASSELAWHQRLDLGSPCWDDYRQQLEHLKMRVGSGSDLPGIETLQKLLSKATTRSGHPLRLVPSTAIPGMDYEQHIFESGEVSTRSNSWHDFFNALVWSRFALTKAAINELHYNEIQDQSGSNRGPVRDALTLFDECGVVVLSTSQELLRCLAEHKWKQVFLEYEQLWKDHVRVWVCGHALLEKFLKPYKSLTAQALLFHADLEAGGLQCPRLQQLMDETLAWRIANQGLLRGTSDLSPLPLMGIPHWWTQSKQDLAFYQDQRVFRQAREGARRAPIFNFKMKGSGNEALAHEQKQTP